MNHFDIFFLGDESKITIAMDDKKLPNPNKKDWYYTFHRGENVCFLIF